MICPTSTHSHLSRATMRSACEEYDILMLAKKSIADTVPRGLVRVH